MVIPALNEAAQLPDLLRALHAEPVSQEIIVIDGGSVDGTAEAAREAGATLVVSATRGRGQAIAAGDAVACREALLFLHADCVFPPGGLVALERLLREQPDVVGGNVRLLFDGKDGFSRWLTGFLRTDAAAWLLLRRQRDLRAPRGARRHWRCAACSEGAKSSKTPSAFGCGQTHQVALAACSKRLGWPYRRW